MPEKSRVLLDALGAGEEARKWENVGFGRGGERKEPSLIKGGLWPVVEVVKK